MEILNEPKLQRFAKKHQEARRPFATWIETVQNASWRHLADIRQTFPKVSYVSFEGGLYVFNVGDFRVITRIVFDAEVIDIREVLNHRDYDHWTDKRRREG